MDGVTPWAEGGDPEEFGWVFEETGSNVTAYALSYDTPNREAAIDQGVPEQILDQFEASGRKERCFGYEFALCDWLQDYAF